MGILCLFGRGPKKEKEGGGLSGHDNNNRKG